MTTYSQTIANVFTIVKSTTTTADRENAVYDFLSVLWDMPNDPNDEILMSAVVPNLANCVRFCEAPSELETIANGMIFNQFRNEVIMFGADYYYTVSVYNLSVDRPAECKRFDNETEARTFAQDIAGRMDDANILFDIEVRYIDIDHNVLIAEYCNVAE